ncbi:MAG: NACHT domain-containing protein, partial [Bacteroidota bacterium]
MAPCSATQPGVGSIARERWHSNLPAYLSALSPQQADQKATQQNSLYRQVVKQIKADVEAVWQVRAEHAAAERFASKTKQTLKDYYKKHFATIRSLERDWSIEELYIQLAVVRRQAVRELEAKQNAEQPTQLLESYESLHNIKDDIELKQLFDDQPAEPGASSQPVRTVLLVGRAGIGKTTLCRKIAHLWANDQWYPDKFEAVYVLPVRNLKTHTYAGSSEIAKNNLETAIARECFGAIGQSEEALKELKAHIKRQLRDRSEKVLIILDGLDERSGASQTIIEQAKNRGKNAHRLWIARPYGVDRERKALEGNKSALLVENIGFNNAHIEQYIAAFFKGQAKAAAKQAALLKFLRAHPAVYGIAHIPINLQILCALWEEEGREAAQQKQLETAISDSLTGLYSELTEYLWERYKKKKLGDKAFGELSEAEKERHRKLKQYCKDIEAPLHQTLGQIALEGLAKGELLIGAQPVAQVLAKCDVSKQDDLEALLGESGFLNSTDQGERYFLHLTFQEYFAGKELARQLLHPAEAKQAFAFISKHKGQQHYQVMFSFMAGEVFKAGKMEGLQKMLEALQGNASGQQGEVAALRALLLQLRCINECMGVGTAQEATLIMEFAQRKGLIKAFKDRVQAGLESMRKGMGNKDTMHRTLLEAFPGLIHLLAQAQIVEQYVDACNDTAYSVRTAAVSALSEVFQVYPLAALERLLKACEEKTARYHAMAYGLSLLTVQQNVAPAVRESASKTLIAIIKKAPEAADFVLKRLLEAAQDRDEAVRKATLEALIALGKSLPEAPVLATMLASLGSIVPGKELPHLASAFIKVAKALSQEAAAVELLKAYEKAAQAGKRTAAAYGYGGLVQADAAKYRSMALPRLQQLCQDTDFATHSAAVVSLEVVLRQASEHQAAVRKLTRDTRQKQAAVHTAQGDSCREKKQYAQALQAYQQAVQFEEALQGDASAA